MALDRSDPEPLRLRNLELDEGSSELQGIGAEERSINYAYGLIIIVAAIVLFGLTMLYSTSYGTAGTKYFYKQLFWAGVGLGAGTFCFLAGYQKLSRYAVPIILGICVLLCIADFLMPDVKGAHRWIFLRLGPFEASLQPSELAKPALVLYLSKYLAENLRSVNDLFQRRGPLPALMLCGLMMVLVLLGKDLGTTLLLLMTAAVMLFAAGLKLRYFLLPASLLPAGYFYIKHFDPMRWARITSFTQPELYLQDDGYQLWNSLLALGSGKWFGIGFMESRLKARYLPEAHTDFILSIVGEELGWVSLVAVMAAYLVFAYFALSISLQARTRQGMLLGFGITAVIVLQAIINIGVVSGAFPTKGMPAPMISYGGSNLLMSLICVGLLLSVAAENASPGFHDELHAALGKMFHWRRRKAEEEL